ncbi:MAG: hypothetical protein QOG00_3663, partial [Pyrinomonadaceae bacterium]|nr:hypothetical protein [Pyrinomonadaceae bacterium]
ASHAFPLHALIDAISPRESPTYRSLDVQPYEFGRKSRDGGGDEGMRAGMRDERKAVSCPWSVVRCVWLSSEPRKIGLNNGQLTTDKEHLLIHPSSLCSIPAFLNSEGVIWTCFLKTALKEDLELKPTSSAMARTE